MVLPVWDRVRYFSGKKSIVHNNNRFPFAMTLRALIVYIITIVLMGLFLWFIKGGMAGKTCAVLLTVITVYRYACKALAEKGY